MSTAYPQRTRTEMPPQTPANGHDHPLEQTVQPDMRNYQTLTKTLGPAEPRQYSIPEMEVIAQKAASSGMFNSGGEEGSRPLTPDQAFMFGLIAEALNMPYALVLMRFEIVMGKPSMKTAYVQAKFQEQGGMIEWVETTGERVKATFTSKRHPKPFTLELTLKELLDRKIASRYDKDRKAWVIKRSYENNPRAMLRYRCITEAVRATDPGILMGFYTEVEAADLDHEDSTKTEAETTARASLVSHLAGRRENPKETHPPVAETAAELAKASKPEPPKEPETPWGKVIADATLQANQALAELAEQNPSNVSLRNAIKPQEVINGVINAFVEQGLKKESLLSKGKWDPAKVRAALDDIWNNEPEDLEAAVAKYLGSKLTELMGTAQAPAQGDLAMA
jgi:hypothetical protein